MIFKMYIFCIKRLCPNHFTKTNLYNLIEFIKKILFTLYFVSMLSKTSNFQFFN